MGSNALVIRPTIAILVGVDEHEEDDSEADGDDISEGTYSLTGLSLSLGVTDGLLTVTELVHSGDQADVFLLRAQFSSASTGGASGWLEERDRSSSPRV